MNHTPGPWKVSNGSLYAQWAVQGQWHGLPSSEANLQLQAAAPDILAALESFLEHADGWEWEGPEKVVEQAKSAVAKARGA